MPILVSDVIARIRRVGLDAQPNTDFYNDQIDLIPAIDSSVKWLVSVINAAKANNKQTEEFMRELAICDVYQTDGYSRIKFDDSVWSIDAIAPLCKTAPNGVPVPVLPTDDFTSVKRIDRSFVSSNYSAARRTIEEVNQNRNNPMSPGYLPSGVSQSLLVEGSSLNITFGYHGFYDYIYPSASTSKGTQITILPEIPKKLCAVFYILNPAQITSVNDIIKFPVSLFNMLYEKSLQFVSYSQGDGTTIWQVTEMDINKLFKSAT